MSPLWPCSTKNCQLPAVQRAGDCILCNKHLCRIHLQDQHHKCPRPEVDWNNYSAQYVAEETRRLNELCQKIDTTNLCARASQIRSIPCAIDLSPKNISSMMGAQNCHANIVFADGVVWIARFRLSSAISPPTAVRDYILQSEAITMRFLESQTEIPCPRIYDWACQSDPKNTVGVGYVLMEKLKGKPLDWQAASPSQRDKIVRQLADIMLEIDKHPFDKLGSLINASAIAKEETTPKIAGNESETQVYWLAKHSTFKSGESEKPLGPFHSSQSAFRAHVEAYLRMIAGGEIGTVENAVDVFLAHRYRLDIIDRIWESNAALVEERFFLKHADDKGDHILVDDDFNIVGIIDWEWCSTASKEEAFSSPCMMWPVAAFYNGSNELTEEEVLLARIFTEKGRDDLSRCVLNGRKVQRLQFAFGPVAASHEDRMTFASLFMGLKRGFTDQPDVKGEKLGTEEREWEAWKSTCT